MDLAAAVLFSCSNFIEQKQFNTSVFLELGSTVVEDLPSILEVLDSTPSTEKKN